MMTQYVYLQTNKFEHEVQILISCNVLYMATQYAYLQNSKIKGDTRWRFERYQRGIWLQSCLAWFQLIPKSRRDSDGTGRARDDTEVFPIQIAHRIRNIRKTTRSVIVVVSCR